mgnify:FL=1
MVNFPDSMLSLVRELAKLPAIGHKSAQRLAYHLVSNDRETAGKLARAIDLAVERVSSCERCFGLAEGKLCSICQRGGRDEALLCVVEKPMDIIAIERSGDFKGYYHVLHGLWAPLRGQGEEDIKLRELVERVKTDRIKEVILAMGVTVEGDATSLYIARMLKDLGVRTTRLAQGLSKGGELVYADDMTLARAFQGRQAV